jgi:hypothetical protein
MTEGEYRVGISFNPSANPLVDEIKRKTAELIDLMWNATEIETHEAQRCARMAMEQYEQAAMWAVKAVTKELPK